MDYVILFLFIGCATFLGAMIGLGIAFGFFLYFSIIILIYISWWKIFEKAGRKGWAALIPFYNTYKLIKIAGRSGWWFFLLFIPMVNVVVIIMIYYDIAKAFGKDTGYTIGLYFLPYIFWPMLAFGDAKYTAPITTVQKSTSHT